MIIEIPHLGNIPGFNPHWETEGYKFFLTNERWEEVPSVSSDPYQIGHRRAHEVIGFGSLTYWPDRPHPTIGLWVKERHRGNGYGNEIMNRLLEYARKAEIPAIRLSVVKTNEPAICLYHKYGFKVTEDTGEVFWMQKEMI